MDGETLLDHLCRIRGIDLARMVPDFDTDLHNPDLLPGMSQARALVRRAVKEKWSVAIFGDYDADGTPAAVLLTELCQKLGLKSTVFLPTRESGYGLGSADVERIAAVAKLLITVDTGIAAVEPIKKLKKLGLKVIVLDHHLPQELLPPADAIVDPFLDGANYPFLYLCGCALAFKLACALQKDFPQITEGFLKWQLDLVAISTVADMMPLRDENRVLVYFGLQVLRKTRRLGLQALLRHAGIKPESITEGIIGFAIGPRLNAAGRLGDNRPVYDLLATDSEAVAEKLALTIELANSQRQALVEKVLAEAEKLLFEQNDRDDLLFAVAKSSWPAGIVGLVAGKLTEKFNRPVIVGSISNDLVRASGRSIEQYPLIDGLTENKGQLVRFGGHRQAAGLTVTSKKWSKFVEAMKAHAVKIFKGVLPIPVIKADAVMLIEEANLENIDLLVRLQPYGIGNPKPLFVIQAVTITEPKTMGRENKHIRARITANGQSLPAVAFSMADRFTKLAQTKADIVGYLSRNEWQNTSSAQFQIVDFNTPNSEMEFLES